MRTASKLLIVLAAVAAIFTGGVGVAAAHTHPSVRAVPQEGAVSTPSPVLDRAALAAEGVTLRAAKATLRAIGKSGWPVHLHRIAFTIAMRESGGNPKLYLHNGNYPQLYSAGNADVGLFQINKAGYGNRKWFDERKLLQAPYNSRIAYRNVSVAGTDFSPWALKYSAATPNTAPSMDWRRYSDEFVAKYGAEIERRTNVFWNAFTGYRYK